MYKRQEYPCDPVAAYLETQYMLGDALLVAPVLREDKKVQYYLPEGRWTDYFTGEVKTGGRYYEGEYDYFSLPLYVKENTLLATGAVNDRPDYDYRDGATLHLYELADGASCTCRMVDVKGADVCAITAERKGGVYSFKADGDMKGLTVILHGICAEGVKAENAQIHTDSVSGCVSAAIDTSTREVKITVE